MKFIFVFLLVSFSCILVEPAGAQTEAPTSAEAPINPQADTSPPPTIDANSPSNPPLNPTPSPSPRASRVAPRKATVSDSDSSSPIQLGVSAGSSFPLCVGAEAQLTFADHLSIGAGYGFMPTSYSQFIGRMVGHFSGQSIYGTIAEDALQTASAPRVSIDFRTSEFGWNIGVAAYYFSISGQADIVNTIQAATGIDLTVVRTLLASVGQDPFLYSKGNLLIGEAHLGYTFKLMEHLGLQANVGVAKILNASMTLSSNSSVVDSNATVQSLYTSAQNQLKSILESDGITPIGSLLLRFTF